MPFDQRVEVLRDKEDIHQNTFTDINKNLLHCRVLVRKNTRDMLNVKGAARRKLKPKLFAQVSVISYVKKERGPDPSGSPFEGSSYLIRAAHLLSLLSFFSP